MVSTLFFVLLSGRNIPGMALMTGSALPHMRGAFMTMNSTVQSASAGSAALLGGWIISESSDGTLINFDIVGYLTVLAGLCAIWLAGRLQVMPEPHYRIEPERRDARQEETR